MRLVGKRLILKLNLKSGRGRVPLRVKYIQMETKKNRLVVLGYLGEKINFPALIQCPLHTRA